MAFHKLKYQDKRAATLADASDVTALLRRIAKPRKMTLADARAFALRVGVNRAIGLERSRRREARGEKAKGRAKPLTAPKDLYAQLATFTAAWSKLGERYTRAEVEAYCVRMGANRIATLDRHRAATKKAASEKAAKKKGGEK